MLKMPGNTTNTEGRAMHFSEVEKMKKMEWKFVVDPMLSLFSLFWKFTYSYKDSTLNAKPKVAKLLENLDSNIQERCTMYVFSW